MNTKELFHEYAKNRETVKKMRFEQWLKTRSIE